MWPVSAPMMLSSEVDFVVNPRDEYLTQLQVSQRYWKLVSGNVYVVPDCDASTGVILKDQYRLIERKLVFHCINESVSVLTCDCEDGLIQCKRLKNTNQQVQEDSDCFISSEKGNYCIHAHVVDRLFPQAFPQMETGRNGNATVVVENLQHAPLLACVLMEEVHLVHLKSTSQGKKLACMTCTYGTKDCEYVNVYRTWLEQNEHTNPETEIDIPRTSQFKYVSYKKIPYPLTGELKHVYDMQESGELSVPRFLIPSIPNPEEPLHMCQHGCPWNDDDPIENGWFVGEGVVYKENCTVKEVYSNGLKEKIKVCYRPSTVLCSCCLYYDGREDLLLNLNNHDFIHYGLLYSYLHLMMEGRNPLAAFHRAYAQKHATLSTTVHLPLHKLRLAWNGFARLLDIDTNEAFRCDICDTTPDVVICDGTSIGLQKQLLQPFTHEVDISDLPPITGTKHTDRVFIPSPRARKLILQFAGVHPDFKHNSNLPPVPLSTEQYRQLLELLRKYEHLISLVDVLERLSGNGSQLLAPANYRSFLQDLARNSPTCSLVQSTDGRRVRHVIKEIVIKGLNVFESQYREKLLLLEREAPILTTFMEAAYSDGNLPLDVRRLLQEVLKRCKLPEPPTNHQYLPLDQTDLSMSLSFFPNMPQLHGNGNYVCDKKNEQRACRGPDTCNKFSKGHPTLSPGIFTLYCQHKVCLGFEVMQQHESPALPFRIIKQRFHTAPRIIIYDNCCKLHQYCLNREPAFFKNTMFLVDRLHWCNHTGCSSGYNMNTYKTNSEIKNLNSQICEQTNAAVSRIKSQLAYMLPDNFIFHAALFFAISNKKMRETL
ncbi:uncharacterized protein [Ptychodera flava]|uniref:uncharacterized protein isoform X2 n=1 Tax=Ptychodera flava TaxID=63121 RepID=UPI00396A5154